MKSLITLLTLFSITQSFAQVKEAFSLSFGPVTVGEERLDINLDDFKIGKKLQSDFPLEVKIIPNSLQWVRGSSSLLSPRVRLRVTINSPSSDEFTIEQHGVVLSLETLKDYGVLELHALLFDSTPINIFQNGKKVGEFYVDSLPSKSKKHLIDYSCAPYQLEVTGVDNDYLSVGCQKIVVGKLGSEYPIIEVYWTAPNIQPLGDNSPPYMTRLTSKSGVSKVRVIGHDGQKKTLTFKAKVASKSSRFKSAIGFGPYLLETTENKNFHRDDFSSALMFYAKLDLARKTSIRAFEAIIFNKSLFNNLGGYFAYEVGSALDNRFQVVPLLGFQHLVFRHKKKPNTSRFIYPQGFELVYRHAFGLKNHHLVYGAFLSTFGDDDYLNTWVRFGKGFFWELNYISWSYENQSMKTFGLSVGIPL